MRVFLGDIVDVEQMLVTSFRQAGVVLVFVGRFLGSRWRLVLAGCDDDEDMFIDTNDVELIFVCIFLGMFG